MAQQLSTNTFGVARFVVSPNATQGTHTTISAAIADASSGDTIWVRDGVYTEDITGKDGVTIQCVNQGGSQRYGQPSSTVVLDGTLTLSGGACTINGLSINPTGASALVVSGTSAFVSILNFCTLNPSGAPTINNSNSSGSTFVNFLDCLIINTVDAHIVQTGVSSTLEFQSCSFIVPATNTPPTSILDQGVWYFNECQGSGSFEVQSTGLIFFVASDFSMNSTAPVLTITSTNTTVLNNSAFGSASSAPVIINASSNTLVTNCRFTTNANYGISGSGQLQYSLLTMGFVGSALNVINPTLTATPIPVRLGNATNITSVNFAASPYTVLSTDEYISVDTSGGAISLLFPDTPIVGQEWVVKDAAGNALIANITITTVSGTDLIDGAISQAIALNYGSTELVASSSTTYQLF